MKWLNRSRLIKLALLLGVAWYALPRAYISIRFAGQIHKPSLEEQFEGLSELLPKPGTKPIMFYRGIPHQYRYPGAFLQSLWLGSTVTFHGYPFQSDFWQPEPKQQAIIVETLLSASSFSPYAGMKACGGFHADFMVRFDSADGLTDLTVCTGCSEVLIFSPRGSRIADLSHNAYTALKSMWKEVNGVPGS